VFAIPLLFAAAIGCGYLAYEHLKPSAVAATAQGKAGATGTGAQPSEQSSTV